MNHKIYEKIKEGKTLTTNKSWSDVIQEKKTLKMYSEVILVS